MIASLRSWGLVLQTMSPERSRNHFAVNLFAVEVVFAEQDFKVPVEGTRGEILVRPLTSLDLGR